MPAGVAPTHTVPLEVPVIVMVPELSIRVALVPKRNVPGDIVNR
jgi:hypothetical protein